MKYYLPNFDDYTPAWNKLREALHVLLPVDRTKMIDFGFDYDVLSPIPDDPHTDKPFKKIADKRADEILAKGNTLLMWSGGIDSTVILASFLKAGGKFTVGFTDSTRNEYQLLFDNILRGVYPNVKMMYMGDHKISDLQNDWHVVTGQVGDQIIGTETYFKTAFHGDYATTLRDDLLLDYNDVLADYLLDLFGKSIEAFPVKLQDYADFLWFVNFVFKYQFTCLGMLPLVGMDTTRLDTYSNFFDDADMQRWAMSNRMLNKRFIHENNPRRYKGVYKKYIYDVLNDRNYYESKSKVSSLSLHYDWDEWYNPDIRIVDKDGKPSILENKKVR